MNRTGIFLAVAGVLALIALVAGVPRLSRPTVITTPDPLVRPTPKTVSNGSLTMTGRLSHPFVGLGHQDVFATVDLRAAEVPGAARSAVNLALVIDRSGSMSGFKLNQAKQAARQLISQLSPTDRLAIVHYGSDVKSLDGMLATTSNKEKMFAYVDGIWDDGGTNIGAGLTTGRDVLLAARNEFKVNRLILISDGQPTEGLIEFDGLTAIVRDIRSYGVSVSSVGVGDDFNEQLMSGFAEVGAGAYAYLQDASQLAAIFQKDLNAAGTQVARGVSLTFRLPKGAQLQRVLGYSQVTRRMEGDSELVTVALPDFAAAQQERVVAHFTVDAVTAGDTIDVSALDLSYLDVLADGAVHGEARLSAMTTDQVKVVMDNRDKDAIVFAARARAADNTAKAAESIEQGDRDGARKWLQANEVLFDEAGSVAGAPAMEEDRQNQKKLEVGIDQASTQEEGKILQKQIRTQARRDYGLMGSTY
ncbi:MAG: VWA domain-containing protein [Archangium sp.]|nr:VWA domain-containing protein [Archangium sp.]